MVRTAVMSVALAGVVLAWACSDDIELPTPYHEGYLSRPSDVSSAVEDGAINVSWSMASEANVQGFVVGFTDSSGAEHTRSIEDPRGAASLGTGAGCRSGHGLPDPGVGLRRQGVLRSPVGGRYTGGRGVT